MAAGDARLGPQGDPAVQSSVRKPATRHTGGYRFSRAAIFLFFAATIDVVNFLDRGNQLRYLILLVPIGSVVLLRMRGPSPLIRRAKPVDRALFALWLFGLAGTAYGVLVLHLSTTARPIFVPMSIGFLYLFVPDGPTEKEVGRLLRAIGWIGALYIVLSAAVNTGWLPGLAAYRQFRNAQFASVIIGLAAAALLRRRLRLVVLIVLAVFNFLAYPSATSILATIAMILTLFVTRPTASRIRPYVVGLLVAIVGFFAVLNLSTGVALLGDYFAFVHKVNANYGRLSVWSQGIAQFRDSPIVGTAFSGGTIATATRRAGSTFQIPYHNDYVLFLAEGGIIGLGLLVVWILALEVTLLRSYRGFLRAGMQAHATLVRLLLVGFNAFFVVAAFNPVLEGMSRSATIFAFYGVAMVLGTPPAVSRTSRRPADLVSRRNA